VKSALNLPIPEHKKPGDYREKKRLGAEQVPRTDCGCDH